MPSCEDEPLPEMECQDRRLRTAGTISLKNICPPLISPLPAEAHRLYTPAHCPRLPVSSLSKCLAQVRSNVLLPMDEKLIVGTVSSSLVARRKIQVNS